jgi:hypothetical protein
LVKPLYGVVIALAVLGLLVGVHDLGLGLELIGLT